MRQLITVLLLLISSVSFSQPSGNLALFPVQLHPADPAPGDDIWLIFRARTANQGLKVGTSFNRAGNDLTFTGCYWTGYATSQSRFVDSVHVGVLPAGRYSVAFVGVESYGPQNCVELARDTVQYVFEVRSALASQRAASGWSVYPTPASRSLSLVMPLATQPITLQLLDATGRESFAGPAASLHPRGSHWQLDLPALPAGVYTLRVRTATAEVITQRVILQ